jgi:hypothetical protein
MFSVPNMEELARFYESDTPVLAYDFPKLASAPKLASLAA